MPATIVAGLHGVCMSGVIGYLHLRLRSDRMDASALQAELRSGIDARLTVFGAQIWGAFQGLFGMHSRELVLVLAYPLQRADFVEEMPGWLPGGVSIVERYSWVPTTRPENSAPLTREGLYVLRFFDIRHADADEIAAISRAAWQTFEVSDRYASRPLALFKEQVKAHSPVETRGRMLLVTWYDGFASWQTSRQPSPVATDNFKRRAALTSGTVAYACRLLI